MLRRAEEQGRGTQLEIEFLDLPGERIPLEDASIDTVVSTFTLCTIPGVAQTIRGIKRVLKPSGKLIFFEHGLSPDPQVQCWQERSEPLFRWAFEGCHVTFRQSSAKAASISNRWTQGTWRHFQSQVPIAGGA
jgi:ubiquinone/menaquinone biosynthesis C-methylase UbiE